MTKALVNSQGKPYISENKVLLTVDKSKYGIIIDNLLGDVDSNGILQSPSAPSGNIVFSGVKEITSASKFLYRFYRKQNITGTVSFPDLEIINDSGCAYSFVYNNLRSVSFPKLTEVKLMGLSRGFQYNSNLQSVLFPKLNKVSTNSLSYCFQYCTSLTTVSFPELTIVSGNYSFIQAFQYCTSLTDVYFNSLTTSSFDSTETNQFQNMLRGVTGCTVHFPSNLSSTISGLYSFGGTNTVLAFDLPATS